MPASTRFNCSPLSLRRKQKSIAQRLTYVALDHQIQCFVERTGKSARKDERIAHLSYSLNEQSPVKFLDSYVTESDGKINLLVIHGNGVIRSFSEDLGVQNWATNPLPADCIVHAEICTVDQARHGILKARPDVVASLAPDAISGSTSLHYALVILTQPFSNADPFEQSLGFKILRLGSSRHGIDGGRPEFVLELPEEVFSVPIPRSNIKSLGPSQFHIHKDTGRLYEHRNSHITIYDLSGLTPRLRGSHQLDSNQQSSLRLSSTAVAYTTVSALHVLDTQFSSVQASGTLRISPAQHLREHERVEEHENDIPPTRLLSYFSSLDLIVALQGRALLTFHLGENGLENEHIRKKIKSGTLADAIGCGLDARGLSDNGQEESDALLDIGSWVRTDPLPKKWVPRLTKYTKKRKVEEFDTCASKGLSFEKFNAENSSSIPQARMIQDLPRAYYVLSKLFQVHREQRSPDFRTKISLTLEMFPPNTFRWLVKNDFMTLYHVETALKRTQALDISETLPPSCLTQTLAAFDQSLHVLMYVLAAPQPMTARGIACAIRSALQILEQARNLGTMKLIENGDPNLVADSDEEVDVRSGETHNVADDTGSNMGSIEDVNGLDAGEDDESDCPEEDADKVHDANALLKTCLLELSTYHDSDIQKALKHELTASEIISFIHHLRTELAGGGWLTLYSENLEMEDQHDELANQIAVVARMLSCAIDALGTGAWLYGAKDLNLDDNSNADTVGFMKAEVSAALEALEESTYLRGILQEFLSYSARFPRDKTEPQSSVSHLIQKGHVLDVKTGGTFDESNAIPLGLKPKGHEVRTVHLFDGRVKERSDRELAHLRRMKIPRYSLDKILI